MKLTKTETEVLTVEIDFARALETVWAPGQVKSTGNYVRPTSPNGYEYECTTGGQTGSEEPVWPETVADTITDGSVVWTCRAFSTNATDTISTVSASGDSGLTVGSASASGTVVSFSVSGGTPGKTYAVVCQVQAASGAILEETKFVTISDPRRC